MIFRIGYATNGNFSGAYWFTDPQNAYDVALGRKLDAISITRTDGSIWVKKGGKPYQRITLEELEQYVNKANKKK